MTKSKRDPDSMTPVDILRIRPLSELTGRGSKAWRQRRKQLVRAVRTAKNRLKRTIEELVPACRVCQGTEIKVCETGRPIFLFCETKGCGQTYFNRSIQSSLTKVLDEIVKKEKELHDFDNQGIVFSGGPGFSPFGPRIGSRSAV